MSLGILLSPPLSWDYRYEPPQCPVFTGTPGSSFSSHTANTPNAPSLQLGLPLEAFVFSCLFPASTSTPSSGPPTGKGDTVPKEPSLPGPTLSFTVFIFLFLTLVFPNFWQQISHFFLISRFSFFLHNTPHLFLLSFSEPLPCAAFPCPVYVHPHSLLSLFPT